MSQEDGIPANMRRSRVFTLNFAHVQQPLPGLTTVFKIREAATSFDTGRGQDKITDPAYAELVHRSLTQTWTATRDFLEMADFTLFISRAFMDARKIASSPKPSFFYEMSIAVIETDGATITWKSGIVVHGSDFAMQRIGTPAWMPIPEGIATVLNVILSAFHGLPFLFDVNAQKSQYFQANEKLLIQFITLVMDSWTNAVETGENIHRLEMNMTTDLIQKFLVKPEWYLVMTVEDFFETVHETMFRCVAQARQSHRLLKAMKMVLSQRAANLSMGGEPPTNSSPMNYDPVVQDMENLLQVDDIKLEPNFDSDGDDTQATMPDNRPTAKPKGFFRNMASSLFGKRAEAPQATTTFTARDGLRRSSRSRAGTVDYAQMHTSGFDAQQLAARAKDRLATARASASGADAALP